VVSAVLSRLLRHALTPPLALRRAFPPATLAAINAAVAANETRTRAEIRVAVEAALGLGQLWAGTTARERALEVFGQLRVWDTAANNGVLLYVLLAGHDIEIVADRALAACVPATALAAVCAELQAAYRRGDYRDGTVAAITALGELAAPHFPADGANPNELPDTPVLL
jgi:uncharacterized membrane protein